MELTAHQQAVLYVVIGLFLVLSGLTAKYLIAEADISATEEERLNAKATPPGRLAIATLGLVFIILGVCMLVR
jgi:hypothetical protein